MKNLLVFIIAAAMACSIAFIPAVAKAHDTCDYKMNWSLVHSEYVTIDGTDEILYWDFNNDGSIDAVWHVDTVKGKCHLLTVLSIDTAETLLDNRNKLIWGEQ
jgi:hypothetical protein